MINSKLSFNFPPEELKKINRDIKNGVLFSIRSRLLKAIPLLERELPAEIHRRIVESPVIEALRSGNLRYDLGLTSSEVEIIVNRIPEVIAKLVRVRVSVEGDLTYFIVELVSDGIEALLSMPEATFVQTYTKNPPYEIPWLKWLLTQGDKIIVYEYCAWYTPGNPNSRSGGAVMGIPGTFRIRPEYSGVSEDNFITRALEGLDDFIYDGIQTLLK